MWGEKTSEKVLMVVIVLGGNLKNKTKPGHTVMINIVIVFKPKSFY